VTPNARRAPACTLVILGAAGDLAHRLLIPAITRLAERGLLDEGFRVLGIDRSSGDDESLRRDWSKTAPPPAGFSRGLFYQTGDLKDAASFQRLAERLGKLGADRGGVVFYLAVAPSLFGDVVEQLGRAGLLRETEDGFRRVVVEKPFGIDYASAQALNRRILKAMDERQIYRMDHFLGKETVRNILVARFGNGVFEPLWSNAHIDHVQITAAETVGVEHRGGYYDKTGALRDMTPNHLFQILELVAMERPDSLCADAVLAAKRQAVEAVKIQSSDEARANSVRGQYGEGLVGGKRVAAYRRSPGVDPRSTTETYVALKLTIDNARWSGVPFYLRTGKAMSARDTEIAIQFKPGSLPYFETEEKGPPPGNMLVFQIQPEEGIGLHFQVKRPGLDLCTETVRLDFRYSDYFANPLSSGYETLIHDCLIGDKTLFPGAAAIERAWQAVMPFLDAWAAGGAVHPYVAGSDGPSEADALLARDGRRWRPVGSRGERRKA
jgi:glucose-6-phosphate 1-dehydrogenase